MTVPVVDLFEVVQVQDHEAEWPAATDGSSYLPVHGPEEAAPVRDPGQVVDRRQSLELAQLLHAMQCGSGDLDSAFHVAQNPSSAASARDGGNVKHERSQWPLLGLQRKDEQVAARGEQTRQPGLLGRVDARDDMRHELRVRALDGGAAADADGPSESAV